jgi:hypothetical protein
VQKLVKEILARLGWETLAAAALCATVMIVVYSCRPKPIVPGNDAAAGLHGAAQVLVINAKDHEAEVARHEAAAKAHEARESELSSNIARLKGELEKARKAAGSVGGTQPGHAGNTGDAPVDDSPVAKLTEIVEQQGLLINELTADRDGLKVALVESKLATLNYKAAFEKETQANALLQAQVARVTQEAKAEITKAEWRGGFKGAALGALVALAAK